jgi:hypothetical protein
LVCRPKEIIKFKVLYNRIVRRIFQRKTEKVTGGWRKLKNAEELLNLQFSPKSVTINKPRRM